MSMCMASEQLAKVCEKRFQKGGPRIYCILMHEDGSPLRIRNGNGTTHQERVRAADNEAVLVRKKVRGSYRWQVAKEADTDVSEQMAIAISVHSRPMFDALVEIAETDPAQQTQVSKIAHRVLASVYSEGQWLRCFPVALQKAIAQQ